MSAQEIAAREYLAGNALGRVAQKYAVSMEDVLEAAAKIPRQRVRAKLPRKGGANVITQTNICMECAKACGGCSWTAVAADGKTLLWQPVEGWTATPVKINVRAEGGKVREIESYHITACPEFERG